MELGVKTRFPYDTAVHCTVKADTPTEANLRIRIPSWAAGEMKVSVNGKPAGVGKPGTYLTLKRQWASGDAIEFTLPAAIRFKAYEGEDQLPGKTRYSVEYGPILLAAVGSPQAELSINGGTDAEHMANQLEPVAGSPLHFIVRGNPEQKFIPYWQVSEEEFTCYPAVKSSA
jgi:uncharacterized protein